MSYDRNERAIVLPTLEDGLVYVVEKIMRLMGRPVGGDSKPVSHTCADNPSIPCPACKD